MFTYEGARFALFPQRGLGCGTESMRRVGLGKKTGRILPTCRMGLNKDRANANSHKTSRCGGILCELNSHKTQTCNLYSKMHFASCANANSHKTSAHRYVLCEFEFARSLSPIRHVGRIRPVFKPSPAPSRPKAPEKGVHIGPCTFVSQLPSSINRGLLTARVLGLHPHVVAFVFP